MELVLSAYQTALHLGFRMDGFQGVIGVDRTALRPRLSRGEARQVDGVGLCMNSSFARLTQLAARIQDAVEMSIRLRNGYEVVRTDALEESGEAIPRAERFISVKHPQGGAYTYVRQAKAAALDFLRVSPGPTRNGPRQGITRPFCGASGSP